VYFVRDDGSGFTASDLAGDNEFWDRGPVSLSAAANGDVHLVWAGNNNVTGYDLNYNRLDAGAGNFSVVGRLDHTDEIYDPVVRADTGDVHFGFFADGGIDGWKDAYYTGWDGSDFSAPVNLSENGGTCSDVRLARQGGIDHVVWNDDSYDGYWEILYRNNEGGSWAPLEVLTGVGDELVASYPEVVVADDVVHVFYASHGIFHLWNDGSGWQGPEQLYSSNDVYWLRAAVSTGGRLHLVFEDSVDINDDGGYEWNVFYMGRFAGTWTEPVNVSMSEESSDYPAIAVDPIDGYIHIAWTEAVIPSQIYYVRSIEANEP